MVAAKSKNVSADVRHLVVPAFPQETLGTLNLLRGLMNEVGAGDEAMRGGRSSAKSATEVSYRAAMHAVPRGNAQASSECDGRAITVRRDI